MEKVKTYLPLIMGGLVALVVFIVSRKNTEKGDLDRAQILEKAREAKLAKSILKKSENEESITDNGD